MRFPLNYKKCIRIATEAATGAVLIKKGVLKNLTTLTEKHLCWSLFLVTLQPSGLQRPANCIKKETPTQVFYCKFC